MKVGMLVRRFPKLSETFILNQVTGLVDAGIDVDIFAWTPGDDTAIHSDVRTYGLPDRTYYIQPPTSRMRRLVAALGSWQRPGLVLRSFRVRRSARPTSPLARAYAASTVLSQGPHDIIHCQFGQLGLVAMTLRELGVVPGRVIVAFRGADLTVDPDIEGYQALFQAADLFLPVCEVFKDRLVDIGCDPDKIRVHRSGIDLTRFEYSERQRSTDGTTRILTIARLVEKKGVEFGIRAVARLLESGRRISYTIVGGGPLHPTLEELVDDLGIRDSVRLAGPANHAGVMTFLRDAHLLLAPSVTASTGDQEGIPNALKEAMAIGLPVVSTFHSGIPELVEDGVSGFLVPERDTEALADRLAFLVDRPERWGSLGRAGRQRIEADYDIRVLNGQLVEIYRGLVARRPGPSSPHLRS
jgi:colanic acid/amylovoran biosynthesis glycosyltransferase